MTSSGDEVSKRAEEHDPPPRRSDKRVVHVRAKPVEAAEPEKEKPVFDDASSEEGNTIQPAAEMPGDAEEFSAAVKPALDEAVVEPVPKPAIGDTGSPMTDRRFASMIDTLMSGIEGRPGEFDVLSVLRMLEGESARTETSRRPPRIGKSKRLSQDIVRLGQKPSVEFPSTTIAEVLRDGDHKTLVLLVRFLGLLGPHGALPSAITDEAIARARQGDNSFPVFLNLFNNRFMQLFYRAWADALPIAQHDRPDDDRFQIYLGSPIGLGSSVYRNLDRLDDRLKLHYAGLTSPKVKSAARLKALLTDVFKVRVEIEQCVGTWLFLDPDDQMSLGGQAAAGGGRLGMNTIVGSKVYSVSDKIRIRIFARDLAEYKTFLPPTEKNPNEKTEKLFDLIDFYLGPEVEYEIELALPRKSTSAVHMDKSNSAVLGHIGWLKKPAQVGGESADTDDVEDFIMDTRFRPVRSHTTVYQ